MKNTFKILLLIILFSIICITSVNASSILMNLENYVQETTNSTQTENNTIDNNIDDNQLENSALNNQTNTIIEDKIDTPRVTSSTVTNDDGFLTTENILSIIIIVIGILLVFLSIAILIRVKQ